VEVDSSAYGHFQVPVPGDCQGTGGCRGALKPAVVFHGGAIPPQVVRRSVELAEGSTALWVLGSTCTVFSAFRLVRAAAGAGATVVIANHGPTRADALATAKIDASVAAALGAALGAELGIDRVRAIAEGQALAF